MPQGNPIYDLLNNAKVLQSIPPDETYTSSDVNGSWENMRDIQGPVHFLCSTGAVSGAPTAQSTNFHLEEADDSSGTNSQKVATQTEATITADDFAAWGQGQTTKPFCRVIVDDTDSSFTGGTTPAIEVAAVLVAQKGTY